MWISLRAPCSAQEGQASMCPGIRWKTTCMSIAAQEQDWQASQTAGRKTAAWGSQARRGAGTARAKGNTAGWRRSWRRSSSVPMGLSGGSCHPRCSRHPRRSRRAGRRSLAVGGQAVQGQEGQGQAVQERAVRGQAAWSQVVQGQTVRGRAVQGQAVRGQAVRGRARRSIPGAGRQSSIRESTCWWTATT